MAANVVCVSSEYDIFANRPVQTSTVNTTEIAHKPTTAIDQSDLEFTIPKNVKDTSIPVCRYTLRVNSLGRAVLNWMKEITRLEQIISYILYSVNVT
jgi:hypothetical protein